MREFKEVRFIATTVIHNTFVDSKHGCGMEASPGVSVLNEFLQKGWELIEFITHYSPASEEQFETSRSHTGVVAVIGIPRDHKPPKDD